MSINDPAHAPIDIDDEMDIDASDQNENANVTKGGNGKHKGKLSNPNMAKLILSRNKGKRCEPKKSTKVVLAPASLLASEANETHYKHTRYECGHEIWEDKEGNYLASWELPEKYTTTKFVDHGDCGCAMNAPGWIWSTETKHRPEHDILHKGKPVYSLRDMVQAEETGADCPEPCRMQ